MHEFTKIIKIFMFQQLRSGQYPDCQALDADQDPAKWYKSDRIRIRNFCEY